MLRPFGYILVVIGLVIIGYAILSSMNYLNSIASITNMYGYGNIYSKDLMLQALIEMALPKTVLGLIVVGIGLIVAKK